MGVYHSYFRINPQAPHHHHPPTPARTWHGDQCIASVPKIKCVDLVSCSPSLLTPTTTVFASAPVQTGQNWTDTDPRFLIHDVLMICF